MGPRSQDCVGIAASGKKELLWPIAAVAIFGLCWLVRAPLLASPGFWGDQLQFAWWSEIAASNGLAAVYQPAPGGGPSACNYPPVYVYVLRGLSTVFEWRAGRPLDRDAVLAWAARSDATTTALVSEVFKLPAVMADALTAVLLAASLRRMKWPAWVWGGAAALYAVLPGVIHDSAVWGQVDSVVTLFMVASLELGRRRLVSGMWAAATVAVLTKPQALVLAPAWIGLTLVYVGPAWRRLAWIAATIAVTATAILVPVLASAADAAARRQAWVGIRTSLTGAVSYYPYTHLNGFSAWFLDHPLAEPRLDQPAAHYQRDDTPRLFGISARRWGGIGLLAVWTGVIYRIWRRRGDDATVAWAACILPLAFFVLSTQMHERYLFPAQALWLWGIQSGRRRWWWGGLAVICLCCAVNMLWVWPGPSEAWWTKAAVNSLRGTWMGMPLGAWCSVLLTAVLMAMLWPERRTGVPDHDALRNCAGSGSPSPA